MLQNNMEKVKLAVPDEAETGSAGEQPARNNPADVNSGRLVSSGLLPYTIYITMPKKTQSRFNCHVNRLGKGCIFQFLILL